jgi:hypothetical protein
LRERQDRASCVKTSAAWGWMFDQGGFDRITFGA